MHHFLMNKSVADSTKHGSTSSSLSGGLISFRNGQSNGIEGCSNETCSGDEQKNWNAAAKRRLSTKLSSIFIVYTIVYCLHPILIDSLKHHGAATPSTSLFLLPHYLAMICAGFLPSEHSVWNYKITWSTWKKGAYIGFIDVLHQLFEKAGLMYAGSAVYIIVSNSSIIWTALVSLIILKRTLTTFQWLSLSLICLGLCVKAADIDMQPGSNDLIGVALTMVAALLQAVTTVTNEKYLTASRSIPGPIIVFIMGAFNFLLLSIWFCVWTLPRWDELVVQNIVRHGGDVHVIAALLFGLFLCGFINAITMWRLVKEFGSITLGVTKGFKAGMVLLLSHVFFCHLQASQCISSMKIVSMIICVGGVIAYSYATSTVQKVKVDEDLLP